MFSTYSALKQALTENQDRMYEALIIAENNTEKLDYELRSLYHGIRGYLKSIRDNNDVNFLLKNQHIQEIDLHYISLYLKFFDKTDLDFQWIIFEELFENMYHIHHSFH